MAVLAEKLGNELPYLPVVIHDKNVSVSIAKTGARFFLPFFHYFLPAVRTSSSLNSSRRESPISRHRGSVSQFFKRDGRGADSAFVGFGLRAGSL
jgi:hypothetical protein